LAGNKRSAWSNVVSTIIDTQSPKFTSIKLWQVEAPGLYVPEDFAQTRKAFYSDASIGQKIVVQPLIKENNLARIEARAAFGSKAVLANEGGSWLAEYLVTKVIEARNTLDEKIVVRAIDKAGNTTDTEIFFVKDFVGPKIAGSWQTRESGLVINKEALFFSEHTGMLTAVLSGQITEQGKGPGLERSWYSYLGQDKKLELNSDGSWKIMEPLLDLPKPGAIMVKARDKSGNVSSKVFSYQPDRSAPVVNIEQVNSNSGMISYLKEDNIIFTGYKAGKSVPIQVVGTAADQETGVVQISAAGFQGKKAAIKRNNGQWQISYTFNSEQVREDSVIKLTFADSLNNTRNIDLKVMLDKESPAPPAGVKAFPQLENGEVRTVKLTWSPAEDYQAGVSHYRVGIFADWQKDAVCPTEATTVKVNPGLNILYVYAVDKAGNVSVAGTDSLVVYTKSPNLLFPENNSVINTVQPGLRWARSNQTGQYVIEVAEDKNFKQGLRRYKTKEDKTELLCPDKLDNNKTYYWRVMVYDNNGKSVIKPTEAVPARFSIDTTAPTDIGLALENNNLFTNRHNIVVSLTGRDAARFILSENPEFGDGQWQELKPTVNYLLSPGDGLKTVWARFKDNYDNKSSIVKGTITIDTEQPEISAKITLQQASRSFKSEAKIQLSFSKPVTANLQTVLLQLPWKFSIPVEKTFQDSKTWSGHALLPEGDGYSGEALLTIKGGIKDAAGNRIPMPTVYSMTIDNMAPVIENIYFDQTAKMKYGDKVSFFLQGESDCEAKVKVGDLAEIPLPQISPGNYSGEWTINTADNIKDIKVKGSLKDDFGNVGEKIASVSLSLNPILPELIEDFEQDNFEPSFKNQVNLQLIDDASRQGQGQKVLQVDYAVTGQQPWAAFGLKGLSAKNYSGQKPALQFWMKGSGSSTVRGLVKLRPTGQALDPKWIGDKRGYQFRLTDDQWHLVRLPLTEAGARKLGDLGFIDIIFFTNNGTDTGTIYLDDIAIVYSML
jgi:hypothetical protein